MSAESPTKVRHQILVTATLVAFLMYLDRICLTQIITSDSFEREFSFSKQEVDWVTGAFFWAYALFQVPAGWLSDRFGARILITIYIAAWSLFTAATGFATGFWTLLFARLLCGLSEAGYYPASSSLVTRWSHIANRGSASSLISLGGRAGLFLAPILTVKVISGLGDWRWAGWVYGASGLIVALIFWRVFREHPRLHPRCNASEVALLAEGRGDFLPAKDPPRRFPLAAAIRSRSLWMANAVQFFTNIGWAFTALTFPRYLKEVKHFDDETNGWITSGALFIGIGGIIVGGLTTDMISRRYGKRLGRMLPMSVTKFIAAGLYLVALYMDAPWTILLAFGMVSFFGDFGLPAMWTTMQDISGKYQAQLFGWGNMWGNFGAAIMPLLFTAALKAWDTNHDYHEGVWLCAAAFVLAGLFALGVNAEKPVIEEARP
ncbi:MFS transporter [Brevifollis gellanilyticus]|uniref:Glucarate transporter n=1 Tax=Brevifollis gellanilyticus TaxID=748831 RepID=A0A512MCT6_9BACT|nr:MFS transporter [Brevifollis gellanilyticus]GEP44539.1 glucarate transporter [Brevifollis gellanilyticus]